MPVVNVATLPYSKSYSLGGLVKEADSFVAHGKKALDTLSATRDLKVALSLFIYRDL